MCSAFSNMTSAQMWPLIGWLGLGYPFRCQRLVSMKTTERVSHLWTVDLFFLLMIEVIQRRLLNQDGHWCSTVLLVWKSTGRPGKDANDWEVGEVTFFEIPTLVAHWFISWTQSPSTQEGRYDPWMDEEDELMGGWMETWRKGGSRKTCRKTAAVLGRPFILKFEIWNQLFWSVWLWDETIWQKCLDLSLSPTVWWWRTVCKYSVRWDVWFWITAIYHRTPRCCPTRFSYCICSQQFLFFLLFISLYLSQLFFVDSSFFCPPSLYSMSLPSSFCVYTPLLPSHCSPSLLAAVPKWAGGLRQTAQGRAEGDPKAGQLIIRVLMFLVCPPVCAFLSFLVTCHCK